MKILKLLVIFLVIIPKPNLCAQTSVGIGTETPEASLHVNGDLKIDSIKTVSYAVSYPDNFNLLAIDPITNKVGKVSYPCSSTGDIKYGAQTSDHDGWVLLDGRALTSLTTAQQTVAAALGLVGNIPDATNKVLMRRSGGSIGTTGGADSIQVLQENLPNVTFTGSTSTAGNHNHSYSDRYNRSERSDDANDRTVGSDGFTSRTLNTGTSGNHTHTVNVPSGGDDKKIDISPPYLQVNTFIFLGS